PPATLADSRALMPTTTSRLRTIAPCANATLARLRSCSSPSGVTTPRREMLTRRRPICGASRAMAAIGSMLSAPPEPASTQPVTPSCTSSGGPSLLRPAWVWMSIRPGATILPRASIVSVASPRTLASTRAIHLAARATLFGAAPRDLGFHRRDPAAGDRHVTTPVEPDRGIDDAPSSDDQVKWRRKCRTHAGEQGRSGGAAEANQLAAVHH